MLQIINWQDFYDGFCSQKGSFNNYVNKLRWVGGQLIVYGNKVNDPSLFTMFVF